MNTNRRIISFAMALALALPCLSLGALGCYRERRDVVVEPRREHHEEHREHVVVKREVEIRP
jgi:hypothetical protein